MGLSVAISGGIILTVFMLILLSLPGFVDKMFSIGDITSQVSQHEQAISKTDISLETLFATSGSPYVNFTLNNDDQEKLWNFEKFNVIVEYESASGDELEELSFSGNCLGALPTVGNWCIESISGDFIDEGILNEGESAEIWTRVSQNLVSGNARVTISTDNGETAMLPAPKRSWFDLGPVPPAICDFTSYGRTFHDTDTGISYVCDSTRDKWLSTSTLALIGEEIGQCDNGDNFNGDPDCHVDFGANADTGAAAPNSGIYFPNDVTITGYSFSMANALTCTGAGFDIEIWGSQSVANDSPMVFLAEIASGLSEDDENGSNLDIDLDGDEYMLWGIDNNCANGAGDILNYNIMIFFKERHDNP